MVAVTVSAASSVVKVTVSGDVLNADFNVHIRVLSICCGCLPLQTATLYTIALLASYFRFPAAEREWVCPQPFVRSRSSDDPSVETACVPAPESGPCVPSSRRVRRASRVPHARATESPSSRHRSGLRPRRRRWNRCGRRLYRHRHSGKSSSRTICVPREELSLMPMITVSLESTGESFVESSTAATGCEFVRSSMDLRIGARTGDIGLVRGVIREAGRELAGAPCGNPHATACSR